jgi:hypothetical protein
MDLSERLTWPQIRERYPDQWAVLVEHDWDEVILTKYTTARVLACGASRAEAVARARPALDAYDGYGCRFTGTIRGVSLSSSSCGSSHDGAPVSALGRPHDRRGEGVE